MLYPEMQNRRVDAAYRECREINKKTLTLNAIALGTSTRLLYTERYYKIRYFSLMFKGSYSAFCLFF